ncbi:bifunctional phosphoserine phosphatase/homoserine phosphotransferase ThrH [Acinetobacter baumannii]|nr:bifunctional phosphoserine phosphatase/homoserine phosphotransferase ThrH [Acinetobacter baumannii]
MEIVCLDLEGVLVPEIWINFAKKTGIKELEATTRDIPDYDVLMTQRLNILKQHGLGLKDIQEVIAEMGPLPGAKEFVEWVSNHFQLVILSDTFYEFAHPLMKQLGWPTIFCHKLETDENGMITAYYNDTTMLGEADHGFLFDAPANVIAEFPQFPAINGYDALKEAIRSVSQRNIPA